MDPTNDMKIRCPFVNTQYISIPLLSDPSVNFVFSKREVVHCRQFSSTATKRGSELPAGSAASAFTALRQVLGAPLSDGGPRPLHGVGTWLIGVGRHLKGIYLWKKTAVKVGPLEDCDVGSLIFQRVV